MTRALLVCQCQITRKKFVKPFLTLEFLRLPLHRGYLGNNNRNQVASVDHYQEDRYALAVETGERYIDNDGYDIALNNMSNDENREYPKENASVEVEIVGAIY